MADRIAIKGECKKCGGTSLSTPDDATNDSWVTCDECGEKLFTWGELKAELMKYATGSAKATFGKIKGFKPR